MLHSSKDNTYIDYILSLINLFLSTFEALFAKYPAPSICDDQRFKVLSEGRGISHCFRKYLYVLGLEVSQSFCSAYIKLLPTFPHEMEKKMFTKECLAASNVVV